MQVHFYLRQDQILDPKEEVFNSIAANTIKKKIFNPNPTAIFATISYDRQRLKYYIPESILAKFWSKDSQRAIQSKHFPEFREFNARLDNYKNDIMNVIRKFMFENDGAKPDAKTLKTLLDHKIKKVLQHKPKEITFFEYLDDFIARSQQGTRMNTKTKLPTLKGTNKGFSTLRNHLTKFQHTYKPKIDFTTIDIDFYNEFIKYLTHTAKLRINSIGDHIKRLKTVLNEATDLGVNKHMAFKSKYFAKLTEKTDSIYLNEAELQEMENLDLSNNPRLEKVRDSFLCSCYTGLRFSDHSILRADQINDGFITTTQLKTGQAIVVPVHPTVQRILDKYQGKLPPSISNQRFNEYLKQVGELLHSLDVEFYQTYSVLGNKQTVSVKKRTLLNSHCGRRSFCTNEYLAGTPIQTIMQISGHKSIAAFEKYIKLTNSDHAKLLKLHWQRRAAMKAV